MVSVKFQGQKLDLPQNNYKILTIKNKKVLARFSFI